MDDHALMAEAAEAATRAYAPYSRFRVGAVVEAADGRRFTGVNVENAAFGATICAEGNAITSAVAAGCRDLTRIAIAGLDADECFPCGNCRQLMREFGVSRVVVQARDGGIEVFGLSDLLPRSFGPESLPS